MTIPIWVTDPAGNNNPFLKIVLGTVFVFWQNALFDNADVIVTAPSQMWWSADGLSWNNALLPVSGHPQLAAESLVYEQGMWAAEFFWVYEIIPLVQTVTINYSFSLGSDHLACLFDTVFPIFAHTLSGFPAEVDLNWNPTTHPGPYTPSFFVSGTLVSFQVIDGHGATVGPQTIDFAGATLTRTSDGAVFTNPVITVTDDSNFNDPVSNFKIDLTYHNPNQDTWAYLTTGGWMTSSDGSSWVVAVDPGDGSTFTQSYDLPNNRWVFTNDGTMAKTFVNNPNPLSGGQPTLFADSFSSPLMAPNQPADNTTPALNPLPSGMTAVRFTNRGDQDNDFIFRYSDTQITDAIVNSGAEWPDATWVEPSDWENVISGYPLTGGAMSYGKKTA